MAFSSAYCDVLPAANSVIDRFDARYFTLDFPLSAIATIVAEEATSLRVRAEYRSNRDLVGLLWTSKDLYGHPLLQYVEDRDYSGTILAFTANPVDPYNFNVTLTPQSVLGGAAVYRLFPFKIEGESVVPNIFGNGEQKGLGPFRTYPVAQLFPDGIVVPEGHHIFVVPFDDLRLGYAYTEPAFPPTSVKSLFFSLVPNEYGLGAAASTPNVGTMRGAGYTASGEVTNENGEVINDTGVASKIETTDVTHFIIENVSPDLRLTKGDVLTLSLGVPSNPRGSKTIFYDIVPQAVDLPVIEWEGDGTTQRAIKIIKPDGSVGFQGVAWMGGPVIGSKLQKDTPIGSVPLDFHMQNISCTGARATLPRRFFPQAPHLMEMTSGYDDTYNITPWRQIDNTWNLGYRGLFTMYMGMSHYFKASSSGGSSAFINKVIKDAAEPLNEPTQWWCRSLFQNAHARGYTFIWSTSYEILYSYCPDEWQQKDWDNQPGLSGWLPPSAFLIPANKDANGPMDYLARVIKHGLKLMTENGATELRFQIGEPWWWDGSYSDGAPAIYDIYTRNKYTSETGLPVPTPFIQDYRTPGIIDEGSPHLPYLEWLGVKLGQSTNFIRDSVKAAYPASLATLLFFSPQIFASGVQNTPGLPTAEGSGLNGLLSIINFPISEWKYPAYDFMQIEDYDWIIKSELEKLPQTREAALELLEYPIEVVHYFVGFVLFKKEKWIWPNINIATREAKLSGLQHIAIWAYPQVIRDGILYDDTIIQTDAAWQPDVPRRRQLETDVEARVIRPVFFAQVGADAFMNSSDRTIEFDGHTWHAVGRFGRLEPLTEGAYSTESGWAMSLAGIPLDQLQDLSESVRVGKVRLLLGLVGPDNKLLTDPRVIGVGEVFDNRIAVEERSATVKLSVRSKLANWKRTRGSRYTHEQQQLRYPTDEGLKFLSSLQYTKLKWGDQNA